MFVPSGTNARIRRLQPGLSRTDAGIAGYNQVYYWISTQESAGYNQVYYRFSMIFIDFHRLSVIFICSSLILVALHDFVNFPQFPWNFSGCYWFQMIFKPSAGATTATRDVRNRSHRFPTICNPLQDVFCWAALAFSPVWWNLMKINANQLKSMEFIENQWKSKETNAKQ